MELGPILDFTKWAIELLLLTIGGAILKFILSMSKDISSLEMEMKYQSGELRNARGQYRVIEEWIKTHQATIMQDHEDIQNIKKTLKHHNSRLQKIESLLEEIRKRVGVRTPSERPEDL